VFVYFVGQQSATMKQIAGDALSFQLALTLIPQVGDVVARNLVSYCGGVDRVFKAKKKELLRVPGIDEVRAESILAFDGWADVEKEISFIEKNQIACFFYQNEDYPARLKGLADAPVLLYSKGRMNVNDGRMVAIVGTRHATDYGRQLTGAMVEGLKPYGVTIISGLAYGIDIAAHRAALKNEMQTIAVLAHGLNRVYPGAHRATAVHMQECGGLITEYKSIDAFEPQNFPTRNRIVAGMADAVVVVESAVSGGALITAEIASTYNRDVFCLPGNVGQPFSAGTNYLIKSNKASLIESAEDLVEAMRWKDAKKASVKQKSLFIELDGNEKRITDILRSAGDLHVDAISQQAQLFGSVLAASLLNLEFKGVVKSLPGKVYRLL
jgi:DNA processing protein